MKQLFNNKYLIAIIVLACIAPVATIAYIQQNTNRIPEGFIQVKSYIHYKEGDLVCGANSPACGVCTEPDIGGVIVDDKCYVPPNSSFAGR